jgi:pilus assembly protein Flp/PilA
LKFINFYLESVIMKNQIQKFIHDESGATAIEYGLLAALVALGIAVGATALGSELGSLFNRIGLRLKAAVI